MAVDNRNHRADWFKTIFESSPIGIQLYDPQGKLLEVNPSCLKIFGVINGEMLKPYPLFDDNPILASEHKTTIRQGSSIKYDTVYDFARVSYPTSRLGIIHLDITITPLKKEIGKEEIIEGYLLQVQDITERKRMEDELTRERRRLVNILEGTHVGTWEWNIQTGEVLFNERWAEIIGYSLADIAPITIDTWQRFTHPDDVVTVRKLLARHFNGELDHYESETRMRHRDGRWIWVLNRGKVSAWSPEGKPLAMSGTHQDISERKQVEHTLRESKEHLNKILLAVPDMISVQDRDFNILYSNWKGFAAVAENKRLIGSKCYQTFRGSDQVCTDCLIKNLETQEVFETETKLTSGRWVDFRILPITDETGQCVQYVEWVRDISERKKAEDLLRQSESRLRSYFDSRAAGFVITKPGGGLVEVNDYVCDLFGYSREELSRLTWIELTYPEDVARERELYAKMMNWETNGYTLEKRYTHKDGHVFWANLSVSCTRNEKEEVDLFIALIVDITQRKQIEKALQESELKYRRLHETMMDAFASVDMASNITETNSAFDKMVGYSAAELKRLTYQEITPAQWHARELRILEEQVIPRGYSEIYEKEYRRKDGSILPVELRTFLMKDDHGAPVGMWAIVRDITDRKQAEAALRRQLEEKEILLKETHHRIKNNITSIMGMLFVRSRSATHPEAVSVLNAAVGRIQSMAKLYERIMISEDIHQLSAASYLRDLTESVVGFYSDRVKVTLHQHFDEFTLDSKRLFPLGIILNELLTNAMKYAFTDRDAGSISVSAIKTANQVRVCVQDDGNGLPDGFNSDAVGGFGLSLVKILCKQLHGVFRIESQAGTTSSIEFNLSVAFK